MKKPYAIPSANQILRSLSVADSRAVLSYTKRVHLERDTLLYDSGQTIQTMYFPETCVVGILGDTGEGARVEVWSVGDEGLVGVSGLMTGKSPYRAVVQVSGDALAVDTALARKHFKQCGGFHDEIVRYYHRLLIKVAQLGICNGVHEVEQRLCRWLLVMQDRTGSKTLHFTQDFIAGALGTRRATISVAAASLQNAGLIQYTPGAITIQSRRGLMAASCSCYGQIQKMS